MTRLRAMILVTLLAVSMLAVSPPQGDTVAFWRSPRAIEHLSSGCWYVYVRAC